MLLGSDLPSRLAKAVASISGETASAPDIGIVLGSGLGELANEVEGVSIPYGDIPGFPVSTAPGHEGRLHIGKLAGRNVMIMSGRVHMYEGYDAGDVAFPVHVMASLGIRTLMITNASGGLNPGYAAGDFVLVEDHLSLSGLAGADPTRGAHDPSMGERFTSLNGAYDQSLLSLSVACAEQLGYMAHRGVYGFVVGPALETPAEVRALRGFGCDVVGMSTVPEVIVARQRRLRVLAISAVCNMAVSDINDPYVTTATDVFEALTSIAPKLHNLIKVIIPKLP
ncbi:MAG: purine-nucleoside phosphorylase [Pseudomonadota bacterium]